jgi:hypothetical protein
MTRFQAKELKVPEVIVGMLRTLYEFPLLTLVSHKQVTATMIAKMMAVLCLVLFECHR